MKKILPLFIVVTLLLVSVASCDLINPDEEIPAYIKVESVNLNTNLITQGANSNNISDVWITLDGNQQGVYQLPATFPVIATGRHSLVVKPGIKNNGIAATRIVYPFYEFYTIDTTFSPPAVMTLIPVFSYKENTRFQVIENFEDPGITFTYTDRSDTSFLIREDSTITGNHYGAIILDDTHTFFESKSDTFLLPHDGSPVFAEIDYKCNNSFVVGLFIRNSVSIMQKSVITINHFETGWNKIYIELTDLVNTNSDALDFSLLIGATKESGVESPAIYIDNIKVIHF